MKVAIIGAGNVGATLAMRALESGLADVVLVDIVKNLAKAKAYDLADAAPLAGHEKIITGTEDYAGIKGSDVVVMTAGLARKPGMTREELIAKNASIVKDAALNIKRYAPDSIVIMVTNPLDSMTYLALKATGFKRERVFGMAGALDGSRFIQLASDELKVPRKNITTYILGSHGDTMVPLISQTRVGGKPIKDVMSREKLDAIVKRTRDRGAEIVSLFGTGSAYYSPSAGAMEMVEAILKDSGKTIAVSAYLDGEYGLKDISIGVPAEIGRSGIRKIVELKLSGEEKEDFLRSAEAIRRAIEALPTL